MDTQIKPIVRIRDWTIIRAPYTEGAEVMHGVSLDHPRLGKADIRTSRIIRKDLDVGEVETVNTLYKLEGRGFDVYAQRAACFPVSEPVEHVPMSKCAG